MDDRVIDRWMRLEIGKLHEAVVRAPRPLDDLLRDEEPTAPTRDGVHRFDPAALRRLAEALPPLARAHLRVPVVAYLDTEAVGSAYVADRDAWKALAHLGVARSEPRDGKLWIGEPLLREFARQYPTCVQFVSL